MNLPTLKLDANIFVTTGITRRVGSIVGLPPAFSFRKMPPKDKNALGLKQTTLKGFFNKSAADSSSPTTPSKVATTPSSKTPAAKKSTDTSGSTPASSAPSSTTKIATSSQQSADVGSSYQKSSNGKQVARPSSPIVVDEEDEGEEVIISTVSIWPSLNCVMMQRLKSRRDIFRHIESANWWLTTTRNNLTMVAPFNNR